MHLSRLALLMVTVIFLGCRAPTAEKSDPWERAQRAAYARADTVAVIDLAIEGVQANLANAESTGFKATRGEVREGRLVEAIDVRQGSPGATERALDVAIQGAGFFRVKGFAGGEAYTRNGNLTIDAEGELVVNVGEGCRLLPPIVVPRGAADVVIGADGTVSCVETGRATKTSLGRIELVTFRNPELLNRLGGSLFAATKGSGAAEGAAGTLLQGYLEGSNVDVTRERMRLDFLREWRRATVP